MPFTSTKDTEFGECYFDISKTDKRLISATLKTYEKTGTYVFLKLFKKAAEEYEFEQRISLTLQEFGSFSIRQRRYLNQKKSLQKTVQQNRHQIKDLNSRARMVDAKYERSPSYFKQFQKQFSSKLLIKSQQTLPV